MSYTETETVTSDATVYHNHELALAEYTATIDFDVQIGAGGGRYVSNVRVTFDTVEIDGVDIWDDGVENQLYDEVTRELEICQKRGNYENCKLEPSTYPQNKKGRG